MAEVRVIDGETLRQAVLSVGTQTDVASMAGLTPQRLSQLVTGDAPVISEDKAARLEDVLKVTRGSLFTAHRRHKIREYIERPVPQAGAGEERRDA